MKVQIHCYKLPSLNKCGKNVMKDILLVKIDFKRMTSLGVFREKVDKVEVLKHTSSLLFYPV